MRLATLVPVTLLLVTVAVLAGGCGATPLSLQDRATCPGESCTDDVRDRVAARAEVEVGWRAPLATTLRLEDGLVCPQPAGVVVGCEPENSQLFSG